MMGSSERKAPERKTEGVRIHYICPKCRKNLETRMRYRQNRCIHCGQAIDDKAAEKQWWTEWLICRDPEEAMRCAEKYNEITKQDFLDPACFMERGTEANKRWPKEMLLAFTGAKDYGRFMRWVAKDGPERLIFKESGGRHDD